MTIELIKAKYPAFIKRLCLARHDTGSRSHNQARFCLQIELPRHIVQSAHKRIKVLGVVDPRPHHSTGFYTVFLTGVV